LKIDSTIQDDHQVKLVVELEPETFERSKQRAAKALAKRVKIPGFRPGKAPYHMVQRHVGDGAIVEEAVDLILQDEYPKIIEEAEIEPYGPGSLIDIPNLEPPTFEFLVPLVPEVVLPDHRALRIEYNPRSVSDADVDKVLNNLRDQQAVIEPADRAAKEGDMVYVVLSGERSKPKEGEEAIVFPERRYPAIIEKADTDSEDEWPFPGFSQKLVGLSADEEITLKHKFPKDSQEEELQGVAVTFKVKVEEVKARTLPELDDEFAKSVGNGDYETMNALLEDIRKSMTDNYASEDESEYESEIVDKLVADAKIKYPPQMLEHELEHLLEDLKRELAYQGMDIDLYLKTREIDMDGLNEEMKPSAEKRIARGLVLMEVGNKEEISVTTEEIEAKAASMLAQIRQIYSEEDANRLTTGEALNGLVSRIMSDEITHRTLERLRKIAMGVNIEKELEKEKAAAEKTAEAEAKTPLNETLAEVEEGAEGDLPEAVEEAEASGETAPEEPVIEAVEAPAGPSDESEQPVEGEAE
jgi:trigger factor